MAELDASVLGQMGNTAQPDVAGSIAKGLTLGDMTDNRQLSRLKVNQANRAESDERTLRDILSKSDYSTDEGMRSTQEKLNKAGLYQQSMEFGKYAQQWKSGQVDQQLKQLEAASATQEQLVGIIEPVANALASMQQTGKMTNAQLDAQAKSMITAQMQNLYQYPPEVQNFAKKWLQNPQSMTFDGVMGAEKTTKGGRDAGKTRLEEMRARIAESRAQTQEKNIDSEIKTREQNTQIRQATANAKAGEGQLSDKAKDLLSEMTVQGITLPQGMRSKKVLYDTVNNLASKYPDKQPEEIAQMIRTGQIDMTGAKTEATSFARREAGILPVEKSIVKPGGFLDQAEKAVSDVDFSKLKAAGHFENWTKEQNSDPKLSSYKARIAELRAEYALVLSKGGQVTDAARHESEKVIPDIITKDQFKEIRGVITQGIEAAKSGVRESMEENAGRKTEQPSQRGPTIGTTENGYRFKGGNPADPASWERVSGQ